MDFEERKKREPFGEDFGEKNRRRGEPRLVEQDDRNRRVFDQGESGWSEALPGVEPKLSSQLERRVQIGFLLGIVMLALIGVLAYRSVVRLRADAAWVDHTHQVISALREVMATTADAETSARGFVITGDENFLAPLIAASGRVSGEVRTVRLLTADNAVQQKNMDVLEPLVSARINNIVKLLEVRRRGGFAEAEQEVASARGKAIQDKIRALIEKMERLEDGYLQQREEVAANSAKWTKTLVIGTGGLALCFIAIGMALLQRDFAWARQAEAELSQFTEQLEVRVWERTGELRAALGRLSESEELLSVTLSSIRDGVVTTDAQGLVTFLNGEAERLTGWRNEDAAGRPL
jgi:CHASE3 domain sensor protein